MPSVRSTARRSRCGGSPRPPRTPSPGRTVTHPAPTARRARTVSRGPPRVGTGRVERRRRGWRGWRSRRLRCGTGVKGQDGFGAGGGTGGFAGAVGACSLTSSANGSDGGPAATGDPREPQGARGWAGPARRAPPARPGWVRAAAPAGRVSAGSGAGGGGSGGGTASANQLPVLHELLRRSPRVAAVVGVPAESRVAVAAAVTRAEAPSVSTCGIDGDHRRPFLDQRR